MRKKPLFFYGWIILAIAFLASVFADGARNSFSVFYVSILDEFGWNRASIAGIFSVNVLIYGISAPFVGALVDRFGPRKILLIGETILALAFMFCNRVNTPYHLYLLFGVAGAIGASLAGNPANIPILSYWFVKRRGMIFGIFISGWGVSFFLVVPIIQYLITRFGWRLSFLLFGSLIAAILLPLTTLFSRHKPEDINLFPDGIDPSEKATSAGNCLKESLMVDKEWVGTNWTLREVLQTYQFWLMFFLFFLAFGFTENFVIVHQVALMRDVGFNNAFAVSIVAFWGIMIIVGILVSFLSDKVGREKTFTLGSLLAVLGLSMFLFLPKVSPSWIAYLYAVFFGLGLGIEGPVATAALADIFQDKNFGFTNGCAMLALGLGGLVGSWFGGFIFDTTRSYSLALIVAILGTGVSCGFLWIAAPRKVKKIGGITRKMQEKSQ